MKTIASGLFAVALIAAVAGCAPAPPPPPPPPPPAPMMAPPPPPPPPVAESVAMPRPYRKATRCGKGWHYVARHRTAEGKLVRGHCVRNH